MFYSKFSESFPLQFSNSKQTKMKWYDSELKKVNRKKQLLYKKFPRLENMAVFDEISCVQQFFRARARVQVRGACACVQAQGARGRGRKQVR